MHVHIVGERRRTIALASLTTLLLYLIASTITHFAATSDIGKAVGRFFTLAPLIQGGNVAIVGIGWWIIWMSQRELIAYNEGVTSALLAITQVRGMRAIGLGFGALVIAVLAVTYAFGTLTPQLGIIGVLVALALLALGLPHSPAQTYRPTPSTDISTTISAPPNRIVDADYNVRRLTP